MKKKFFALMAAGVMLFGCGAPSFAEAYYAHQNTAPYEEFYGGNPDYILVQGHMGYGIYVDLTSLYIIKNDEHGIEFEVNTFMVNEDIENAPIENVVTSHYFKKYDEPNSIYYACTENSSYVPNHQWKALNLSNKLGAQTSTNNTFIIAMERITDQEYRY